MTRPTSRHCNPAELQYPWVTRVPLFIRLCAQTQLGIDRALHVRKYEGGQSILLEGHRPSGLPIMVSGLVRIYRMAGDGRVHVHKYIRPYAPFNITAALDGRPNPQSAEAVKAVEVAWLARSTLLELMARDQELLLSCMRLLTLANRELMARLDDLGFRTVPARLAQLLLRRGGFEGEANIPLDILSQDEIAAVLGTSREVLGRALRQLYDLGLVRREGRSYVIIDRPGLEKLAGE